MLPMPGAVRPIRRSAGMSAVAEPSSSRVTRARSLLSSASVIAAGGVDVRPASVIDVSR